MQFRHELKFYINMSDYMQIRNRIKHIMRQDAHADVNGEYRIRSLYFDNYNDKALMEKVLGINNRAKYRIRYYDDNHEFIRLEKKLKVNGLTAKQSARLTKTQCEQIIAGDYHWMKESKDPVIQDLYQKMHTEFLKPKTIVDYIREAYIYPPGNVRVTIDKKIRSGIASNQLFEKGIGIGTMHENYIVLEVKYDNFLPEIINDLVQLGERERTSISKYALCRQFG